MTGFPQGIAGTFSTRKVSPVPYFKTKQVNEIAEISGSTYEKLQYSLTV